MLHQMVSHQTPHHSEDPPLPRPAAIVTPSSSRQMLGSYEHASFIVILLERHSLQVPWGMALTRLPHQDLVIRSMETPPALIRGVWKVPCSVLPFNDLHTSLTQRVVQLGTLQPFAYARLLSGDVILAWNGQSIVRAPLCIVTQQLRSSLRGALLVYRAASHQPLLVVAPPPPPATMQNAVPPAVKSLFTAKKATLPKKAIVPRRPEPTNPLFCSSSGQPIPYCDNAFEYDPDNQAVLFLDPHCRTNFADWLQTRKRSWRCNNYQARAYTEQWVQEEDETTTPATMGAHDDDKERHTSIVAINFWTPQGYSNFQEWLQASKSKKWKPSYSWNRQKRQRLEQDWEEVVHIQDDFEEWLRVRKSQWRVMRRKRQRERSVVPATVLPTEVVAIDALLEAQEELRAQKETKQQPFDIIFMLEKCPDDTLAHCLRFLDPLENGKLLCLNKKARRLLQQREHVWRQLCPPHWTLPRRPRKPWHELYWGMLKAETEKSRKRLDDLLMKASNILLKGDQLQSIEKLIAKGEKGFQFEVNYTSGVVCERNSLLNLAVINGRHKVVRWLVESKKADLETYDRGGFTPLLNAAWAGDRYLVRFLMLRGADRSKLGMFHYTKPLSSPDFKGLTAEGWAEKKGFHDIARLIRLGL